MKKLIITSILIVFALSSFFISDLLKQNDSDGKITIVLVDQIGDIVSRESYAFDETDTLFGILKENYEVGCADSSFHLSSECQKLPLGSRVLLKIDNVETDWMNTFIAIYINDEYSNYGIDNIPLKNGDVIKFEYTVVGEGGDN